MITQQAQKCKCFFTNLKNPDFSIDKRAELYIIVLLISGFCQYNIAELCKGSTADSDSVCLGSNPSSAATALNPVPLRGGSAPFP